MAFSVYIRKNKAFKSIKWTKTLNIHFRNEGAHIAGKHENVQPHFSSRNVNLST